jgi:zinc protease
MSAGAGSSRLSLVAVAWVASCAASPPRAGSLGEAGPGAADQEEALRAHPPPLEPAAGFKLPEPYVATLENGMRLVVFERHSIRVVAAELVVQGGTAGLPPEEAAAVHIMVPIMTAGTQRQSETQLFNSMNANLIQLHTHAGSDWLGVTLRAPSSRFDQALTILRNVTREPTFPKEAVEVVRRRLIGGLTAYVDQPGLVAQRNLFGTLFGPRHPYTLASGRPDLDRVSRDDVVAAWRDMMDPAQTTLIVAGDVNPLVLRQSVGTLFGDWVRDPAARPPAVVAAPVPAAAPARIIAVDRPGARQATIAYSVRLPDDSIPQRAAGALVQELIAQAEARAKEAVAGGEPGATWGAWRHFPGATLWWEKAVAPDRISSALRELDGWFGALRDRGPDADDLTRARARVIRPLPASFETVENISATYGDIVGGGLPLDWMGKLATNAAHLTREQLRGALGEPTQTRVVVVANLTTAMNQLLSLGWGPVEVHDPEGRLLRTVSR